MASSIPDSMPEGQQLVASLERVAKQAENCIRYRAVFSCIAVILAALGLLMLVDFVFRREETGLRWLAWMVLIGAAGYAAWRWIAPIRNLRIQSRDVARWIETQQPQWSGRLMTALELSQVEPNDVRFGSHTFRIAAIDKLQPEIIPDWSNTVDWSKFKLLMATCFVIAGLIVAAILIQPEYAVRALGRLLAPWSDRPWPRQDQLHFVNLPSAVGRDQVLQVEIGDSSLPLPDNIVIQLRQANSNNPPQIIQTQVVGDIAVANLPAITDDIEIRAEGGDDRLMPWQKIQAVATPNWKMFHFEIKPPEYLLKIPLALERLTKAIDPTRGSYELTGQRIQVVAGSGVRFEGELDAPFNEIDLRLVQPQNDSARQTTQAVPSSSPWKVSLSNNRVMLESNQAEDSFAVMERSIAWVFRVHLANDVELDCQETWQVEVIPDRPPDVVLNPFPIKSLAVASDLYFSGQVRDDWGLDKLVAKISVNERSDSSVNEKTDSVVEFELEIKPEFSRQVAFRQSWNFESALAAMGRNLKAQDQVAFWLEATDVRGQVARTGLERFTIEPPQRQLENIASRQHGIAQQISEVLKLQQSAKQLSRRNADSIKQNPNSQAVQQQHVDAATSVAQMQQTIRQQLTDSAQSTLASIDAQLELIEQNKLSDAPLAEQLSDLRQKIVDLSDGAALNAHRQSSELQSAIEKSLASKLPVNAREISQQLENSQSQSEEMLSKLLEGLDRVEASNRQREKLLQIAEQQEEVTIKTNQLGLDSLRSQSELQNQVVPLAATQNQLAAELEQWLQQTLKQSPNDESAPQSMQDAAKLLLEQNVVAAMRNSGGSLRSKQVGDALQTQEKIQQILRQAIEKLTSASKANSGLLGDLAQQEQRLRELAMQSKKLADQQRQLADNLAQTKSQLVAELLAEKQQQLLEAAEQLEQQLSNLKEAKQHLQNAMEKQAQAAGSAVSGQTQKASEQASVAAQELSELTQQIEQRAQQARQQVQMQQMFEVVAEIEQLAMKQEELIPQYLQLSNQLQLQDVPADFNPLRQALVNRQSAIRDQLRQMLPSIVPLQVFHWALQQADHDLTRAIAAAERDRLKPDAIDSAQAGLRKMQLAIESVASKSDASNNDAQQQPPQEQPNASDQQQTESLPPIVSLKLIRALQLELKLQTESLENAAAEERSRKLGELTGQQRDLAALFEAFVAELQSQQQQQ